LPWVSAYCTSVITDSLLGNNSPHHAATVVIRTWQRDARSILSPFSIFDTSWRGS